MSIAQVVTLGIGPDSSISAVVTLGFSIGESAEPTLPLEAAFIQMLLTDAPDIAALAAARIFPHSRPQGSGLPAATSFRVSGGPRYADEGETGLEQARMQVDCWAASYSVCKRLAAAIRDRASEFTGEKNGWWFYVVNQVGERDRREGGGRNAEYLFNVSMDFSVWARKL